MAAIQFSDIAVAQARIKDHVLHTPLLTAPALSQEIGCDVRLKPEFLQETGSFKLRGAMNAMLSLDPVVCARGVVTASSGNHGPALACAASRLGAKATVCLSEMVPENKVANVRANGGIARVEGRDYDASLTICKGLVEREALQIVRDAS